MTATTTASPAPPARVLPAGWRRDVNLARELAWTQFKLKYTGSVLGYVWSLLKPLMLFSILYTIFVQFFHQHENEFPVQLLLGIVLFTLFTDCTGAGLASIAGAGHLIRKAYFPRHILVVASTMTALITFAINFLLIILVAVPIGHMHLGLRTITVPLFCVELYMLSLGVALLLAAFFVFFRDIGHLWEIASQVLFYMSAIVYPASLVVDLHDPAKQAWWRRVLFLNPLAQIVEDIRHALVTPDAAWTAQLTGAAAYAIPFLICAGALGLGMWVFHRLTPKFAENL